MVPTPYHRVPTPCHRVSTLLLQARLAGCMGVFDHHSLQPYDYQEVAREGALVELCQHA